MHFIAVQSGPTTTLKLFEKVSMLLLRKERPLDRIDALRCRHLALASTPLIQPELLCFAGSYTQTQISQVLPQQILSLTARSRTLSVQPETIVRRVGPNNNDDDDGPVIYADIELQRMSRRTHHARLQRPQTEVSRCRGLQRS